jgi:hypothetical protein
MTFYPNAQQAKANTATVAIAVCGRESVINRALDGSTYPSQKLAPSSFCKNGY